MGEYTSTQSAADLYNEASHVYNLFREGSATEDQLRAALTAAIPVRKQFWITNGRMAETGLDNMIACLQLAAIERYTKLGEEIKGGLSVKVEGQIGGMVERDFTLVLVDENQEKRKQERLLVMLSLPFKHPLHPIEENYQIDVAYAPYHEGNLSYYPVSKLALADGQIISHREKPGFLEEGIVNIIGDAITGLHVLKEQPIVAKRRFRNI